MCVSRLEQVEEMTRCAATEDEMTLISFGDPEGKSWKWF